MCSTLVCTQSSDDAGSEGMGELQLGDAVKAALRFIHTLLAGDLPCLGPASLVIPPGPALCLGLAVMGEKAAQRLMQTLNQHRGNREAVRALLAVHFRHLGLGAAAAAGEQGAAAGGSGSQQGAGGLGSAADQLNEPPVMVSGVVGMAQVTGQVRCTSLALFANHESALCLPAQVIGSSACLCRW